MTVIEAAQHLREGSLVVFPTETVYGIGALASNEQAVKKIFEVKNRPQKNPLILHIAEKSQLHDLVEEISPAAQVLMDAFWPGPLTLCFQKASRVSDLITAGLATVCIRQPSHPLAHQLLKEVGEAVAAPSANISGKPSTTRTKDAQAQFGATGVYFLDGEESDIGLESTVVDCSGSGVRLLRPGSISKETLEAVLGYEVGTGSHTETPESPGQLLAHYAPQGALTVLIGSRPARRQWIQQHSNSNEIVFGLVGPSDELSTTIHQHLTKEEDDLEQYAQHLYAFLNWCDAQQAEQILLEFPQNEHQLREALLNRLEKASEGNMIWLDSV